LAKFKSKSVLECPIDTDIINKISEEYYSLKISINDQVNYFVTYLTILKRIELQSFYPQVLYNDGSFFNLQLRGSWMYFPTSIPNPIVKIQTP